MLTFAIGVLTQQWNIAVMGIVYSYITAAAMWQNFRARLPYLYDPWSEELPDPPTLVHAMVAVSVMVELGAILTGIFIAVMGRANAPLAQAASYALSAIVVWFGTIRFMDNRGVSMSTCGSGKTLCVGRFHDLPLRCRLRKAAALMVRRVIRKRRPGGGYLGD